MKKLLSVLLTLVLVFSLTAFGSASAEGESYKVGICNFVDDASLNQIIANIRSQLESISAEKGVTFEILEDNCNTDANVMNQIIANFIADDVDLMVAIATPVAMGMQGASASHLRMLLMSTSSWIISVRSSQAEEAYGSIKPRAAL